MDVQQTQQHHRSLLSSWCWFPGLKHPLQAGNSRWITPRYGKGQAGSSWLPRILAFSGPAAAGLCNQHRLVKKFLVWSMGNSGYRKWKSCQGVLQSLCLCCRYAWSLHYSFLLLLGSTIFFVLLVRLCSRVSSCLSDSALGALGSDFVPWDISEFLSSFGQGQSKS